MPVTGLQRGDNRVEYVVVERTAVNHEFEIEDVEKRVEPTQTIKRLLRPAHDRRYPAPEDDGDSDDDDGDGEFQFHPPPTPYLMTITLGQAQATGNAVSSNGATETVVVQVTPQPQNQGPPPPPHHSNNGGISQTTEHLLIAAGSIGATIIVVMVILAVHTMRKRGLTFAEAVKQGKYQVTRRGPPPPPKGSSGDKQGYSMEYGSMNSNSLAAPEPAMARLGSISSQRPLIAPQRNASFRTERSASPETVPQSFLLDSPLQRNNSHRRENSETPSSPVLPLQNSRTSESTHNTRSMSSASGPQYTMAPPERTLSPLPPPPTFKQFLNNRPSQSNRPGLGAMISRFSWTNSQAPQTPHDPNRDTNSHTIMRDSFMTQRSSLPRFRTVDSWVQQQSNRIETQKLQEQLGSTPGNTTSMYLSDDDSNIPSVPEIPKNMADLREGRPSNTVTANQALASNPVTPPPPPANGLPGKNIKHERHDTQGTVDTAPIFRQHPGTEVRFSTRSLVPSEILNVKMKPTVLS